MVAGEGMAAERVAATITPRASGRDVVVPLAPERYKVQFTASAGLKAKLERLQVLCGRPSPTAISRP